MYSLLDCVDLCVYIYVPIFTWITVIDYVTLLLPYAQVQKRLVSKKQLQPQRVVNNVNPPHTYIRS